MSQGWVLVENGLSASVQRARSPAPCESSVSHLLAAPSSLQTPQRMCVPVRTFARVLHTLCSLSNISLCSCRSRDARVAKAAHRAQEDPMHVPMILHTLAPTSS